MIHSGYCYQNPVVNSTAKKILEITGIESGKCVFLSSGSESVEYSVKLVKSFSEKPYFLQCQTAIYQHMGFPESALTRIGFISKNNVIIPSDWEIIMDEKLTKHGIKTFLAPINWIIVTGLVFFISAGGITHLRAWIYMGIYAIGGLIIGMILLKKSPKLLNDRGKMQEGNKQLDKIIILAYFLFAIVITPLVAGIDKRFNVTEEQPFFYLYIGIILYLFSAIFSIWPMLHNPFFEGMVRIQKNKNHRVINTGPYKIVRHPGYIGMLLGSISLPLALGSVLAFIPVLIMALLIFIRTYYEDTTLKRELTGYSEYCKNVKYRLIPYIW